MMAQVFRRARNRQGQAFGGAYAPSLTAAARDGEWATTLGRDRVDLANRKALSVNSVFPKTLESHPHYFQKRQIVGIWGPVSGEGQERRTESWTKDLVVAHGSRTKPPRTWSMRPADCYCL